MYFRFWTAILNFRLPVTLVGILNRTIDMPDSENLGVAIGISLISCLQAELFSLKFVNLQKFIYFRFTDAIFESRLAQNLLQVFNFVAQTYLGKVTKTFLFIPSSYELAIKSSVLGYICTPISTMTVNCGGSKYYSIC